MNRVRLPILLVVSWTGKKVNIISLSPFRLIIWSSEMGSAVPSRVSLLIIPTQAESGAYPRSSPDFRGGVNLFTPL